MISTFSFFAFFGILIIIGYIGNKQSNTRLKVIKLERRKRAVDQLLRKYAEGLDDGGQLAREKIEHLAERERIYKDPGSDAVGWSYYH